MEAKGKKVRGVFGSFEFLSSGDVARALRRAWRMHSRVQFRPGKQFLSSYSVVCPVIRDTLQYVHVFAALLIHRRRHLNDLPSTWPTV